MTVHQKHSDKDRSIATVFLWRATDSMSLT